MRGEKKTRRNPIEYVCILFICIYKYICKYRDRDEDKHTGAYL